MNEYTTGLLSRTIAGPATSYIALSEQELITGAEITGSNAGDIYHNTLSLTRFAPVGTFAAGSVGAILDLIGLNGRCVGSAHTILAAALIARKIGTCDAPLGGTPHMQHACSKGLLTLDSLTASRDEDAVVRGTLWMLSTDGSASPVAITDGVAWPSTIIEDRYRLGLCKIAGVQFPQVEEISLSFNVEVLPPNSQLGSIFTTDAGVLAVTPELTLRGRDLSRVKTSLIELGGNAATHANTVLQFIKIADGASFETFASSVHTTLTIGGLVVPQILQSGSAGSRSTNSITLRGKRISGAAPVAINVAAPYSVNP